MALIMPITVGDLKKSAIQTTIDAGAIGRLRFFVQHALTKFIVLPVSAMTVVDISLILAVIKPHNKTHLSFFRELRPIVISCVTI